MYVFVVHNVHGFYPHDNSWGSTIEAVICMYVTLVDST